MGSKLNDCLRAQYSREPDGLLIAQHEISHAVMRKIVSLPATRVLIDMDGGLCEGTDRVIHADKSLLLLLAGPAWETFIGFAPPVHLINFRKSLNFDDIRRAWQLLERVESLRMNGKIGKDGKQSVELESVEASIRRWYSRTIKEIAPHKALIIKIGEKLHEKRELSARQMAALLRGVGSGLGPP